MYAIRSYYGPDRGRGRGEGIILRRLTSYAIRGALGALAFILVFSAVFATAVVLRARQGPVSISAALPYAASLAHDKTGVEVAADSAFLVWVV